MWKHALLTAVCVLLVYLAGNQQVDAISEAHIDQTLKRALTAFAIARGLNAVISVAQGTEFAVQPAGVGVNFAPGELLDPINDLVERFSWVMLASSSSLGLQKVLLQMSQWVWVSAFLALVLFLYLVPRWLQWDIRPQWHQLLQKLVVLALLLRFLVPLTTIVNEQVYALFLQKDYERSVAELQNTKSAIETLNQEQLEQREEAQEGGWLDKAKRLYNSTLSAADFRQQRYQELAEGATQNAITVIVAFILQTLLLPLLFLWLLSRVVRWVWQSL